MLATAELYNSGGREHQEYIDTNQGWQIKSSVIGSNLRVYYPNTYLGEEWDTYANLALEFYLLAAQDSMEVKNGTVGLIQEYYSACPNNIDWNELLDPNNLGFSDREFFHNWILLKNLITSTKNKIAQAILETPILTQNPLWQTNAYEIRDSVIKLRC